MTREMSKQRVITKICDNADPFLLSSIDSLLDEASHILLQHSLDVATNFFVLREDSLGTK